MTSKQKEEPRNLRKKIKRLETSRNLNKAKNRDKGRIIKAYQDRQNELIESRTAWKEKFKKQENENIQLSTKIKSLETLLELKDGEFERILSEFNEVKKNTRS